MSSRISRLMLFGMISRSRRLPGAGQPVESKKFVHSSTRVGPLFLGHPLPLRHLGVAAFILIFKSGE